MPTTNARLTQASIEAPIAGAPSVRLTQVAVETVLDNTVASKVRLSQAAIEVVIQNWAPSPPVQNFISTVYPMFLRGLTFPVMKTAEFSTMSSSTPNFLSVRVLDSQNPCWHWLLTYEYLKNNPQDLLPAYAPWTDYAVLQGFCESMQGRYRSFLFNDATDNYVGPAVVSGSPNPLAQQQLLGDGAYWYVPLQRNFGGQFLEDVTDLNTAPANDGSPLAVYLNGLPVQSSAYQVLGPGLKVGSQMFYGAYVRFNPWTCFTTNAVGDVLLDPVGHVQQATKNATTAALSPAWNDSGGTTMDGGQVWQDKGLATIVTAQFNFFFRVQFESDRQDIEQFMQQLWTIGGQSSKNGSGFLKLMTARPPALAPTPCMLAKAYHF